MTREGERPGPADEDETRTDFGAAETLHVNPAPREGLRAPTASKLPSGLDQSTLSQRERALQLTRYALLRRIGAGGMGVVYLAYDPSLDRKVAVKLLRALPGDDPVQEAHARLLREAQALAKLSHPNVVGVYDVGTYDADVLTTMRFGTAQTEPVPGVRARGQGVFLVMEYVEGPTLAQWLDERVRGWREVLEMFIAAGRGLVAAHAVGVIHRDFKPSNVLVGRGGRACVFDFGLARAAGDTDAPAGGSERTLDPLSSSSLSSPLTRVGAVLGTPAYMAPEQRGGGAVDERADQFSFCVALYEGLYGNRPFAGDNLFALEEAKISGRIEPPRRPARVPPAIHRALLRGLQHSPAERWPTLTDLLEILERPLRRDRRRWLLAGGLALGAALGTFAVLRPGPPVCTGAAQALSDTWGAAQRDAIAAAFAATRLPYADDAAARVSARLDAYAEDWIAGHTDACEAATVRREQSTELLDRRMRCLDLHRRALAAVVAVLQDADPGAVEHAVDMSMSLPAANACADLDAVLAEVDLPPPDQAGPVAVVEDRLAAGEAEAKAGHVAAALALTREAEAESRALTYRPIRARVLADLGGRQLDAGEHAAAETSLADAYWEALATRQDLLSFQLSLQLVGLVGETLARPRDGERWLRDARALLDRIGGSPERTGELERRVGQLAEVRGDLAAAISHYQRALELLGESAPAYPEVLGFLGSAQMFRGDLDAAQARFEQVLVLHERSHGPGHPRLGIDLASLGNVALLRGDFELAERRQREALALWRAALPPQHERLAFPLSALGDIAMQKGEFVAALAAYDEARQIWEHNFGPQHPRVAAMLERVAATELVRGDLELAAQHAARALALWEAAQSPDPQGTTLARLTLAQVDRAREDHASARARAEAALAGSEAAYGADSLISAAARSQLGAALVHLGEGERAEREADAALAAVERAYGADSLWLAELLGTRGEIRRARGRLAEARADLERGLSLADPQRAPYQRAELSFLLAQVLRDSKQEPDKARALAESALEVYRRAGAERMVRAAQDWLRARAP